MPDFNVQVGEVGFAPSTAITAKQKPQKNSALAGALTSFTQQGIAGGATKVMEKQLAQATGASVNQATVQGNVDKFTVMTAETTPDEYLDVANSTLDSLEADAKTVHKLVQGGQLSSLQGEAFTRKRMNAIKANPFLASLGARIDKAGGPLGGGGNAPAGAFQTAELTELQAQAKGAAAASEAYEKEIKTTSLRTGVPETAVRKHVEMRARFKERVKDEKVGFQESFRNGMTKAYYDLTEQMTQYIDPESGVIDATGVSEMSSSITRSQGDAIAAVNSSLLPDGDKKTKIELIKSQHDALRAQTTEMSKTKVQDRLLKETEGSLKLMGTQLDPYRALFALQGNDAMLTAMTMFSRDQVVSRVNSMYGEGAAESLMQAGVVQGAKLLTNSGGDFQPTPLAGTLLSGDGTDKVVEEAVKNDPTFVEKMKLQAYKHPVETLDGLRGGPLLRSAASGAEGAQTAALTTVSAVIKGLRGDMDLVEGGGEISASRKSGRGSGSGAAIRMPSHMKDRELEISELYKVVQSSPWMWPAGVQHPNDAFNAIVNGHHVPILTKTKGTISLADQDKPSSHGQMGRSRAATQKREGDQGNTAMRGSVLRGAEGDLANAEAAKISQVPEDISGFLKPEEKGAGGGQVLRDARIGDVPADPEKDSAPSEGSSPVDVVRQGLLAKEGAEGDTVTSTPTGQKGMTVKQKVNLVKEGLIGEDASDEEAIDAHLNDLHTNKLPETIKGYDKLSPQAQAALLDASYNLGHGALGKFSMMKAAAKRGDNVGVVRELLDTANEGGKSMVGLAKRRATDYNEVAKAEGTDPITEIQQFKDGRVEYRDADGDVIFQYTPKGGKHDKSKAQKVSV